jgi:hypothetical protein
MGYYAGEQYSHTLGIENACRTTAFAHIYDKTASSHAKAKTQLCRSVKEGRPCKFGDKCTYAHSKTELIKPKCSFGNTCRTKNSKTNPCQFDHSDSFTPPPASTPSLAYEVKVREEELAAKKAAEKLEMEAAKERERLYQVQAVQAAREGLKERESFYINFDESDSEDEESDSEDSSEDEILSSSLEDLADRIWCCSAAVTVPSQSNVTWHLPSCLHNQRVAEQAEEKAMNQICEQARQPTPQTPSPVPFNGWACDPMKPIDVADDFGDEQDQKNFQNDRLNYLEQICSEQESLIHQQQDHINIIENQFYTPCIPVVISPYQHALLFGVNI